ncbi:MAG: serine/threonine-protein kinase [Aureliella sp.]
MHSTTMTDEGRTRALVEGDARTENPLLSRYQGLLDKSKIQWTTYHRFHRELGSGGQGIVYLSERRGADGFTQPVAIKVFSPERFSTTFAYRAAMERVARVASRVATIQHDNLLNVQDFVDREQIRIMVMEWIDGYDLRQLMCLERLKRLQDSTDESMWDYFDSVIATFGPSQCRFKAGVAVAIVRDCLAALSALHQKGILHGDIKPANIMVKRTGAAKLIDMGSAFELQDPPPNRTCTPVYAAPEVLEGATCTPQSDLASLGYVLVEMLSGKPCFDPSASYQELLEEKRLFPKRLAQILPGEVVCNEHLMNLCKQFVATDPEKRFPSAEAANLRRDGAAQFHRQLVFGDLASEYGHDLHRWLEAVARVDTSEDGGR